MYEQETKRIRKRRGINNVCFHLSMFDGVFPIRGHIHLIIVLCMHAHTQCVMFWSSCIDVFQWRKVS